MHRLRRINDAAVFYMNDLTSRVVAESGKPNDRFHLGKLILQSFKDNPDIVLQIDGGTGKSESNASVMQRSVRCANAFRKLGLRTNDVIVLMAPNHIDLAIPFYAALYLGIAIAPVDMTLKNGELEDIFELEKPKIVFCQSNKVADVRAALKTMDTLVITFDSQNGFCNFNEFLDKYDDSTSVDDFRAAEFDPNDTLALLIPTSGTTGLSKAAATTQKNFASTSHYYWIKHVTFPTPSKMYMVFAPLQWLTASAHFISSALTGYTRLQSSSPMTKDHVYDMINTYKPTCTICSPTFMTTLLESDDRKICDFSCFEYIQLGGSAVPAELIKRLKELAPNTEVVDAYGNSELTTMAFTPDPNVKGSCGRAVGHLSYRLVDPETQEDIIDTHTTGELWLKGPSIFKGYYNNPAATEETFAEDRWFKTGDLFYRDDSWNFYFVDRLKMLLKYMNHQISPVEVENVIRRHPGVSDVAVTGIPEFTRPVRRFASSLCCSKTKL